MIHISVFNQVNEIIKMSEIVHIIIIKSQIICYQNILVDRNFTC
jgi:hypothetical protein